MLEAPCGDRHQDIDRTLLSTKLIPQNHTACDLMLNYYPRYDSGEQVGFSRMSASSPTSVGGKGLSNCPNKKAGPHIHDANTSPTLGTAV